MAGIGVVVLSGSEIVRRGLADMLHLLPGVEAIAGVATVDEALGVVKHWPRPPQALIVGFDVEGVQAGSLTQRCAAAGTTVLALLRSGDPSDIRAAMALGPGGGGT